MNYQLIYDRIVALGKERVLEGYKERHHIVPRCIGGSDDPDNLVELTPEEHYVCHQLLVKIHPGEDKLTYAANMMAGTRPNNKAYGWLRKKFSKMRSVPHNSKTVHCMQCGASKIVPVSYVTKFCSRSCSGLFRQQVKSETRICKNCDSSFKFLINSVNTGSFCSKECYWNYGRPS